MSNKIDYTTVTEVKAILGITSSGEDAALLRYLHAAQSFLESKLGIIRLDRRTINDEILEDMPGKSYFYVRELPFARLVRLEDFDNTELETHKTLTVRKFGGEFSRKIFTKPSIYITRATELPLTITYVAGYSPFNQLDILDFAQFTTGDTVSIEGFTVTEGTSFNAETSEEVTAQNIYDALILAGATLIELDGTIIRQNAAADANEDLAATLADPDAAAIVSPDMPEEIKIVLAWLVGGFRKMKVRLGGIASYTLGLKSVSYIDDTGANKLTEAEAIIETFASRFQYVYALST